MDNIHMNTIKFLKKDRISLNGVVYKPHTICNIPANFGCINYEFDGDGVPLREGIDHWFNHKGFTYIIEK